MRILYNMDVGEGIKDLKWSGKGKRDFFSFPFEAYVQIINRFASNNNESLATTRSGKSQLLHYTECFGINVPKLVDYIMCT